MSLDSALRVKQEDDKILVMCHYPPFDVTLSDSQYTQVLEKYKVDSVVYGHLHGKDCRAVKYLEKNNIKYYLTSCDQVNNKLVKIY